MKIGIIIGSIREGRTGHSVAEWVNGLADKHEGARAAGITFELIDLAAFDVPLLTSSTVPGAGNRQYDDDRVTAWSKAIDACQGYIYVTPEYNHSVPGAFKNAFDSLGPEWMNKAVGFVSYGADGGVRAVEHWRTIVANLQMVAVRQQVPLSLFTEFTDEGLQPLERRDQEFPMLVDQLVDMTLKLRG